MAAFISDSEILQQEEERHKYTTTRTNLQCEPGEFPEEVDSVKEEAELKLEDSVLKEPKSEPEENIVIYETMSIGEEHDPYQDGVLANEDIKQEIIELGEYKINFVENDSVDSVGEQTIESQNLKSSEDSSVELAPESDITNQPQVEPLADTSKNSYPRKKCEHCDKTFGYQYRLALHRIKAHGSTEKPIKSRYASKAVPPKFHCDQCDKSYHFQTHLATHKAKVHGVGESASPNESCSHTCKHCKHLCATWKALVHHLRLVHGESIDPTQFVQCPACRKRFTSAEEMAEHFCLKEVVLIKERPFSCDLCDKAYFTRTKLEQHYSVHPEYHNFKCDQCWKSFFNERELNKHKKTMHKSKEAYIECVTCHKLFKSQQNWKRHQELHSDTEQYCCEHCGKRFKSRVNLKSHVYKIHRDDKVIPCTICGKTLKGKIGFELHMRIHNNDRRYRCSFPSCEKMFFMRGCLKKHEQSHTKDYKYKCKFCNYGSVKQKLVISHEERRHKLLDDVIAT